MNRVGPGAPTRPAGQSPAGFGRRNRCNLKASFARSPDEGVRAYVFS